MPIRMRGSRPFLDYFGQDMTCSLGLVHRSLPIRTREDSQRRLPSSRWPPTPHILAKIPRPYVTVIACWAKGLFIGRFFGLVFVFTTFRSTTVSRAQRGYIKTCEGKRKDGRCKQGCIISLCWSVSGANAARREQTHCECMPTAKAVRLTNPQPDIFLIRVTPP